MYENHGCSKTRLYSIWNGMKNRCYRPSCVSFKNYGGRGILICDEWLNSFVAFQAWAQDHGYRSDLSIDRIDPNGNYRPDNCRWATDKRQSRNKRPQTSQLCVEVDGKRIGIAELSRKTGIGYTTLRKRIRSGVRGNDVWKLPEKAIEYFKTASSETGNGKAKLREHDVSYIAQSDLTGAELARHFNVSQSLVSMIKSGQRRQRRT